jgi:hypothetical protein
MRTRLSPALAGQAPRRMPADHPRDAIDGVDTRAVPRRPTRAVGYGRDVA